MNKTAIRLGVEGGSEAKAGFEAFKRDGQAAFGGLADVADATAKRVTNSYNRALGDVEASMQRLEQARAKIAAIAPQSAVQMRIADTVGTGYAQPEGSAKTSAAAFAAADAEQARYAATAEKVRAALFPTWQVQRQLNQELYEAKRAFDAGALSADHYAMEEKRLRQAMDQLTTSSGRQVGSLGQRKAGFQQLGFQISDVTAQASTGTSALVILAQQGGQVAQAIDLIGPTGKMGAFAAFMGGPWGAIILGAVTVTGMLVTTLLKSGDAADKAKTAKISLTDATQDLNRATGQSVMSHEAEVRASVAVARAAFREEVDKRNLTVTTLNLAKARLVAAQAENAGQISPEGGINVAGAAEAVAARQILGLNKQILEQEKGIGKAREAYRGIRVDQLLRGAEERADKGVAATRRYEGSIYNLRQQLAKGKISEAEFSIGADKAIAVRDAASRSVGRASAATSSASAVDRSATAARRDATEALREMATALDGLEAKYNPEASQAKQRAKTAAVIAEARRRYGKDIGDLYEGGDMADRWRKEVADQDADLSARIQKNLPDLGISVPVDITPKIDMDAMTKGLDGIGAKAMGLNGMMGDLRGTALKFVNTLDPADWENWGRSGRSIISMVKGELIKLALINPIKNLLSGSNLSTLGSKLSSIFKIEGIVARPPTGDDFLGSTLGRNAAGTPWWSGGATWVGENGPEIINAPRGSRIMPAGQSRQMAAAVPMGGGDTIVHVHQTIQGGVDLATRSEAGRFAQAAYDAALAKFQDMRRRSG